MNELDILISMASWEDRFHLGSEALIAERRPGRAILFHNTEEPYAVWMQANRDAFAQLCSQAGVLLRDMPLLATESARNWRHVAEEITGNVTTGSNVVVDLTTMPRELLWWILWLCDIQRAAVRFVYHRPHKYGEWLTRDPQTPRLVYRMSGMSGLGKKTALVVLAGYDVERTQQLVTFFEPSVALVGLQKDSVDPMNPEHMKRHRERLGDNARVTFFETDAYSVDQGQSQIEAAIGSVRETHNLILSSLGPKLSAVAMYRMQREDPRLALAYAPSKEFSKDYSTGIGERLDGMLLSSQQTDI